MRQTLILGNSHSQALKAAQVLAGVAGSGAAESVGVATAPDGIPDGTTDSTTDGPLAEGTGPDIAWVRSGKPEARGDLDKETALARAAALGPEDVLVLMQLGTQHNLIGLLEADPPFTIDPARIAPATGGPGTVLIPRAQIAAWLRETMHRDKILPRYAKQAACRIFHVMPPPPKEDLCALAKPPKAYRGQAIAQQSFAPAPHRLALWQLEEAVLSAHLKALGITPLPVPARARTAAGYLDPAYWAEDATHANAAYGALVLAQIDELTHQDSAA